jgi:hypothetical protein
MLERKWRPTRAVPASSIQYLAHLGIYPASLSAAEDDLSFTTIPEI